MADQGQHPYEYAGADPVNGHDPTGEQDVIEYTAMLAISMPSLAAMVGMSADITCLFALEASRLANPGMIMMGVKGCVAMFDDTRKPGWGGGGGGGPNPGPKIGIGVEVPGPDAVHGNVLNLAVDTGHTIVYLKDASGTVVKDLSFGPGDGGIRRSNVVQFLHGNLPGNAHWQISGSLSTWEDGITPGELGAGKQAIDNFKQPVPNYTMTFNCTSAALSITAALGKNLPGGIGPVVYAPAVHGVWGPSLHSDTVPNPYALSVQMTSAYGSPGIAPASSFPNQ